MLTRSLPSSCRARRARKRRRDGAAGERVWPTGGRESSRRCPPQATRRAGSGQVVASPIGRRALRDRAVIYVTAGSRSGLSPRTPAA